LARVFEELYSYCCDFIVIGIEGEGELYNWGKNLNKINNL